MGKTFENCVFGPWALRPVLRADSGARDHVLAWGVVSERRGGLPDLWALLLALVPGFGPVIATIFGGGTRPTVLMVTRDRLVLLDGKRKPGAAGWVRWESGLGGLEMRKDGWTYVIRSEEAGKVIRLRPACGEEGVDAVLRSLAKGAGGS